MKDKRDRGKADFRKRFGGARQPERRQGALLRIYGAHAVEAALRNPRREVRRIYASENAAQRLGVLPRPGLPQVTVVPPKDLDRMLGGDSVHQGLLIEVEPLPDMALQDLPDARLILFLDQITDPHNVGAILRSATAFGVDALVITARNSPPLEGALAKAASGGLDHVPVVAVPNLARALAEAGELDFWRIGLDSEGAEPAEKLDAPAKAALVLGAEDRGLRRLTREHCDTIRALTTYGPIASLNVSNAAAIALHLVAGKMRNRPGR
jgi:23S rRNA (guanosine2251-2'-O)-methyltransferase